MVTARFNDAALHPRAGGQAGIEPATPTAAADPLVQVTVREISDIVREVAAAARSDRSTEEFLAFFVDRVLRAMAAEGVVVWRSSGPEEAGPYRAVRSIGRVTESSIPVEGARFTPTATE